MNNRHLAIAAIGMVSMMTLAACQQNAPAAPSSTTSTTASTGTSTTPADQNASLTINPQSTSDQNTSLTINPAGNGATDKTYAFDSKTCNGMTSDVVANILGTTADQIPMVVNSFSEGIYTCVYGDGSASFTVRVSNGPDDAKTAVQEDLPGLGTVATIPNLGDEAMYAAESGKVEARQGNVTVIVISPNNEDQEVQIAKAFLATLQ